MTSPEFNQFLEILARLIEIEAQTVEEAAQIVRDSRIKA